MISVNLKFISGLESIIGTKAGSLEASQNITLREFLTLVDKTYFKNKLLDKEGRKVYPVVVLVDGEQRGLNERLKNGSTITFVPIISGG